MLKTETKTVGTSGVKKRYIALVPVVIVLVVVGFFVYNYEFHVLGGGEGNGTAHCTSYLQGNCLYNATFDPTTNDLTVYQVGFVHANSYTPDTMYNVGFAYMPAVTRMNGSYPHDGPVGAVFQASNSLSNNVLNSGQGVTITFDSINASAPANNNGQQGYIWIAYTPTSGGSDCVGPISTISTNCSFFNIGYINLNT